MIDALLVRHLDRTIFPNVIRADVEMGGGEPEAGVEMGGVDLLA
jgi:hypothetical protein